MTRPISFFDVTPILPQLASGQLILTPNLRLASRITASYALESAIKGNKVVASPAVYSVNQWIERCWQRLLITGQAQALSLKPLSNYQEQAVWEQIVTHSDLGAVLLRASATAQRAASAYQNLVDWQLDINQSEIREQFVRDEDASVLLTWIEQFEQQCRDQQWLPRARIAEQVLVAFQQKLLVDEGEILGVGFETLPPLQQALVNSAGRFEHYQLAGKSAEVSVVSCESAREELSAAAVWAKQIIKNNPNATVGIVIPELAQQRQVIQRLFIEVFEPDFSLPITQSGDLPARKNLPFNFSAGYPLLEAPIIMAAVNALSIALPTLERDTFLAICQSPFYGLGETDFDPLSGLMAALYELREFSISTAKFRQLADKIAKKSQGSGPADDSQSSPLQWEFASALQSIASLTTRSVQARKRPIADWIPLFKEILSILGWPGNRRLDSIEYQQASQWQQALVSLSAQQLVLGPVSFGEALGQLRGILSRTVFQPQSAESSLQILGTLEAAGLQFSHLWLMSMSEQQWPPAASPNPLLPFSLQREYDMPHASSARELQFAKDITHRFIESANNVVVSYPSVIDENPAAASMLFEQYPRQSLDELLSRTLSSQLPMVEIRRRFREGQKLEAYDAADAPTLQEGEVVKGGSALFASQSACPFRAFIGHRLGLKPLAKAELGLNAAERGSLLHRALELIWQKLKDRQALLALSDQQLHSLCEDVSRYTLDEFSQGRGARIGLRYKRLENNRLQKLLVGWLTVESSRAGFTIESLESSQQFQFGPLQLQARIDRIDRLDDGGLLIIDYKTGKPSVSNWWGDRPEEPQLPLYSMLTDSDENKVTGVAYAQVRVDGCSLKGVGEEQLAEEDVRWQARHQSDSGMADWPQLKQSWVRVLTALANDFILGKSGVDPKQSPQTCQYCHFASICRINHQ